MRLNLVKTKYPAVHWPSWRVDGQFSENSENTVKLQGAGNLGRSGLKQGRWLVRKGKRSSQYSPIHNSRKCYPKWAPTAGCSKANEEARLVERKVCSIAGASSIGEGGGGDCPKAESSYWQSVGFSFYRWREGATCRNSTVSSDSQLETGHAVVAWSVTNGLSYIQLIFSSRVHLFPFLWDQF